MEITKLQWLDKKKCIVYIDYEIAFVLYKGDLSRYGLNEQAEISRDTVADIKEAVLLKRAKLRLLYLLKNKDYTEMQLRKKLKDGWYPPDIIERAIAYIHSYGYINDEDYVFRYLECYGQRRTLREMKQKLLEKGIDAGMLKRTIARWEAEGTKQDEKEMIRRILKKRNYPSAGSDRKEREKQVGFLLRKGFSRENIMCVLKEAEENAESF